MHELAYGQEAASQACGRVEDSEVVLAKSLLLDQGHRQSISHCQGRCGGNGRHGSNLTCLSLHAHIENDVGPAGQCGGEVACQGDEPDPEALDVWQKRHELLGLSGVGERHDHVTGGDHPQIAVDSLGRMKKERGYASAGHRRGDLLGNDAALAHARDDQPAAALAQHLHGPDEALIQPFDEVEDRLALGGQHPPARL